ncbi:MAG: WbqC family protein [Elusimicrobiota bacterium]
MSPRVVAIHQPECFPWLGFLDKAAQADVFVLLDDAQYSKNYFNNRNKVRTAQGWSWLTIPVETAGRAGQTFAEAKMGEDGWRRKHLATWKQSYGSAPFGDRYIPFLEDLYARPLAELGEFNTAAILWLFEQFEVKVKIETSSKLGCAGAATDKLLSICKTLGATEYLSGISGKEYLEEAKFKDAGINVRYQDFHHPIYTQRFEPFIPALSSFDLLFNHGPQAAKILRDPSFPRLTEIFT